VIAQANAQKAVLAKEVKSLRAELDRVGGKPADAGGAPMIPLTEGEQALADALKKRREFEGKIRVTSKAKAPDSFSLRPPAPLALHALIFTPLSRG
jgi:hypothetical protein